MEAKGAPLMDLNETLALFIIDNTVTISRKELVVQISGYGTVVLLSSILLYYLYIKRIFVREEPPTLTTWGLWLLLDVVATAAELDRGVFNAQLVSYTIGTFAICVALFQKRKFEWDPTWDTLTTLVVFVSIALFLAIKDPIWSLTASLFGMTMAAIPLVRDLLNEAKQPWTEPWDAWLIITIGSVVNLLDGKILSSIWLGLLQACILTIVIYWHVRRAKLA